jgi:hypothetical protein
MSDFENKLTEMLSERAETSLSAVGLAEGARSRHRRRRALKVGLAGAAVVAAIVAVPVGLGALSVDEGGGVATEPGPVKSSLPAGWRSESYRDVEFAVPPDWEYGSLDDWCASGGSVTDAPRVERPGGVVATIACPSSAYGVRIGEPPGNPPAGAVVRSASVGGVTLSVVAPDAQVADKVAGSLHEIQGKDHHGCVPEKAVPPVGDMTGSSSIDRDDPIALCRYDVGVDGANLNSSEEIELSDNKRFWLSFDSAQPGRGPDSGPGACSDSREDQALLVQVGDQEVAWVHYSGCDGHGIDEFGTTLKLNPQVMYWALPRGGFALDGSVPIPKEVRP